MGLQERNFPEGGALVPTFRRSGAPAAGGQGTAGKKRSTALAGWGRSGAQLVGVTGIFAVVGAQVVAKAESSPLVTLAGLFLAGGSAAWMGRGESGPGRLGPATLRHAGDCSGVPVLSPILLEAHSHGGCSRDG